MARFILTRLIFFPLAIFLANICGFAYAFYLGPIQATRNPYSFGVINLENFWFKYGEYLQGALVFDFGLTPTSEPLLQTILRASSASLGLIAISIFLSTVLGFGLGIAAVKLNPPRKARWLVLLAAIGQASPGYFIGVIFIGLSVNYVIWGKGSQPILPFQGFGWDAHLVLPALTLMFLPMVKISDVIAGLLVDEMKKQYVVVAYSFGRSLHSIRSWFAFKNILPPVLATCAGSFRLMIAELIIVERLFNWPGLGKLISGIIILNSDSYFFLYPPLLASVMVVLVSLFFWIDLLTGSLARFFDKRLSHK